MNVQQQPEPNNHVNRPAVLDTDINTYIDTDTDISAQVYPIIAEHWFGIVAPPTTPEPKPAELAA